MRRGHNYGALGSDSPISVGILVNWCTLTKNSRMKLDNVHWERGLRYQKLQQTPHLVVVAQVLLIL